MLSRHTDLLFGSSLTEQGLDNSLIKIQIAEPNTDSRSRMWWTREDVSDTKIGLSKAATVSVLSATQVCSLDQDSIIHKHC